MKFWICALCFAIAGVAMGLPVSVVEPAEMFDRSEAIVIGQVMEAVSYWDGDFIRTDAAMQVVQSHKGGLRANETIVVSELGGEVDGVGQVVSHSPRYRKGEFVFVLLARRSNATFRTVGGEEGMEVLVRQPDGEFIAKSALLADSDGNASRFLTTDEGIPIRWPAEKLPLDMRMHTSIASLKDNRGVPIGDYYAFLAVQRAQDQWTNADATSWAFACDPDPGGCFAKVVGGSAQVRNDGRNLTVAVEAGGNQNILFEDGIPAVAVMSYDTSGAEMVDADVLVAKDARVSLPLDFSIEDDLPPNWQDYDLFTVLEHEYGHALGLGHVKQRKAVMTKKPLRLGERKFLGNKDVNNLRALYPWGYDGKDDLTLAGVSQPPGEVLVLGVAVHWATPRDDVNGSGIRLGAYPAGDVWGTLAGGSSNTVKRLTIGEIPGEGTTTPSDIRMSPERGTSFSYVAIRMTQDGPSTYPHLRPIKIVKLAGTYTVPP